MHCITLRLWWDNSCCAEKQVQFCRSFRAQGRNCQLKCWIFSSQDQTNVTICCLPADGRAHRVIPEARSCSGWKQKKRLVCFHDYGLGTEQERLYFLIFVYTNEMCGAANLQLEICGTAKTWLCHRFGWHLTCDSAIVNMGSFICYDYILYDRRQASRRLGLQIQTSEKCISTS